MSTATKNGEKKTVHQLDVEKAVSQRYSSASQAAEQALCCPVKYDTEYLDVLPQELIERDYGCGDPSKYLSPGQTVLDLGCGGGKICYISSQIVGPTGRVIGVDMNDDMLALARRHRDEIGGRIGWHNVEFHKAKIQDLALDLDRFEAQLRKQPIDSAQGWLEAQRLADQMRRDAPVIADDSVDVVASNCVLNLVDPKDRPHMFREIHRVLRRRGCAVISDIVSDEAIPEHLKNDARLWSGCISGAFVERELLAAFADAGFYGIEILSYQEQPWATVEGIELRSVTVRAYKGKEGACDDYKQAVIYQGPWKSVTDDDGHVLRRGVRTAVCAKTYDIYTSEPYSQHVTAVPPRHEIDPSEAQPFDCRLNAERDPRETKGQLYDKTELPDDGCCGSSGECC